MAGNKMQHWVLPLSVKLNVHYRSSVTTLTDRKYTKHCREINFLKVFPTKTCSYGVSTNCSIKCQHLKIKSHFADLLTRYNWMSMASESRVLWLTIYTSWYQILQLLLNGKTSLGILETQTKLLNSTYISKALRLHSYYVHVTQTLPILENIKIPVAP